MPMRAWRVSAVVIAVPVFSASIALWNGGCNSPVSTKLIWIAAQMIPGLTPLLRSKASMMQQKAWDLFTSNENDFVLDVPVLDVTFRRDDILSRVEELHGKDWRQRPLYLKGLWNSSTLHDPHRNLSLEGLLREKLRVPYFSDATKELALTPDSEAPLGQVVFNISRMGYPHKIGTQLLLQTYPDLVQEVAPNNVLTRLFGSYFEPQDLVGSGPFRLLPALTTVPLFVAAGNVGRENKSTPAQPRTDLHCEPIGNVAVQLMGEKKWTLVSQQYSFQLRPALAPDGRAFFASFASHLNHVPRYHVVTKAGDALWVPTWMWHRVDYAGKGISIGASLFHFRPVDYVRNNPLFAALVIPAMLKELVGISTQ